MPDAAPADLKVWSYHSVKGGVGKTTLSLLTARALAQRGEQVLVVDLDLTGTSLADGLALRAPTWADPEGRTALTRRPDDWLPREEGIRKRARDPEDPPFLNDFLLRTQNAAWTREEAHPEALAWKLPADDALADRLMVLPSSAFPADLEQVLALLYDEPFSAWAESRLEWLLDAVLEKTTIRHVVIDTPPCIPGISRAVLSAAMRLGRDTKLRLSDDGELPPALWAARVQWLPWLVTSEDRQDLRALERWLAEHDADEVGRLGVVINRFTTGKDQVLGWLRGGDVDGPMPLPSPLERVEPRLVAIEATGAARLFSVAGPSDGAPVAIDRLIAP